MLADVPVPGATWRDLDPRAVLTAAEAEHYGIALAGTVRQWAARGGRGRLRLFPVGVDPVGSPLYPLGRLLQLAGLTPPEGARAITPPEGIRSP